MCTHVSICTSIDVRMVAAVEIYVIMKNTFISFFIKFVVFTFQREKLVPVYQYSSICYQCHIALYVVYIW